MQSKIRICFISLPCYPLFDHTSEGVFGGAELQTYFLANGLSEHKNFDVHVIAEDASVGSKMFGAVTVHRVPNQQYTWKWLCVLYKTFIIYKYLSELQPKYIYKRGLGNSILIAVWYAMVNKKTKVIYQIANEKDINGDRFVGFFGRIMKYITKLVDIILVQTKDQYNLLPQSYIKKFPENGIIRNIYEVSRHIHASKDYGYILWVGRCVNFKHPEIFIDIVKAFPNQKFVMICPKVDMQLWNSIYQESIFLENLTLIERVSYIESKAYFKNAKIFVNTSSHEGFPNTFLQAINASVPIVSLSVNPDQLLQSYQLGVYCNNNIDVAKDAIFRLLNDRLYYDSFTKNAMIYLSKVHSKKTNVNTLVSILSNSL